MDPAPVPAPEPTLIDEPGARAILQAVPEFDLEAGLQVVRGRFPTYLNLLRKYLDLHEGAVVAFQRCRTDGQTAEAQRLVHSLIGASGFLGAKRVSTAAYQLEEALRAQAHDEELQEKAAVLALEQSVFCAAIRSLPQVTSHPTAPA